MTGHVALGSHLAEQGIVRDRIGAEERYLVQNVEGFKAKLDCSGFSDFGVLQQRGIPEIVGIRPDTAETRRKRAKVAVKLLRIIAIEDAGIDPAINGAFALGQRDIVE